MRQALRPRAPSPRLPDLGLGPSQEGGILTGEEGEPKQSTDPSGPSGESSMIVLETEAYSVYSSTHSLSLSHTL